MKQELKYRLDNLEHQLGYEGNQLSQQQVASLGTEITLNGIESALSDVQLEVPAFEALMNDAEHPFTVIDLNARIQKMEFDTETMIAYRAGNVKPIYKAINDNIIQQRGETDAKK